MRLIDADKLKIDIAEKVLNRGGVYKVFGYSKSQVDSAPTITLHPNAPLTLDELREMDGEPVWVFPVDGFELIPANYLVNVSDEMLVDNFGSYLDFDDYGKEWLACLRKPANKRGKG